MEEFTSLSKYPIPKDTGLVKSIIAENDGYIIRDGVPTMQQVWPGSAVHVRISWMLLNFCADGTTESQGLEVLSLPDLYFVVSSKGKLRQHIS